MDECDLASNYALKFNQLALANQQRRGKPLPGKENNECEDCGEEIPKARREAQPGCTRCILCQTAFERSTP